MGRNCANMRSCWEDGGKSGAGGKYGFGLRRCGTNVSSKCRRNKKPGPVAGTGFLGWERIYSFFSPSELSFLSFLSSSPQPPQLPARRVETEAMETTIPSSARRVNLSIR